jgi:Polysaccharide lyase
MGIRNCRPSYFFKIYMTPTSKLIVLVLLLAQFSCNKNDVPGDPAGCDADGLLETYFTPSLEEVFINEDGTIYINDNGICTFTLQYFDPNFLSDNYITNSSGTFIIGSDGSQFPTKNNHFDDFESYGTFTDMFLKSPNDTALYWTGFTLQSPAAPSVPDYVALRKCILDGTCTFIDNRIDLVADPMDPTNQVIRFTSVAPSAEMITAKSSMGSSLNYFLKDSDVWFQADYYIESAMPFSFADFENAYFYKQPGPRIVIRQNKLAVENKFGAKSNYTHNQNIEIPQQQWFTIKLHLKYSNTDNGIIELWQDGVQLISTTGINLPTSNSIQSELEVGVTATPEGCVMLVDNLRISDTPF